MLAPETFALIHLGLLVGVMALAAVSARRARKGAWRHRGVSYRRLTTDEVLQRLNRTKPPCR